MAVWEICALSVRVTWVSAVAHVRAHLTVAPLRSDAPRLGVCFVGTDDVTWVNALPDGAEVTVCVEHRLPMLQLTLDGECGALLWRLDDLLPRFCVGSGIADVKFACHVPLTFSTTAPTPATKVRRRERTPPEEPPVVDAVPLCVGRWRPAEPSATSVFVLLAPQRGTLAEPDDPLLAITAPAQHRPCRLAVPCSLGSASLWWLDRANARAAAGLGALASFAADTASAASGVAAVASLVVHDGDVDKEGNADVVASVTTGVVAVSELGLLSAAPVPDKIGDTLLERTITANVLRVALGTAYPSSRGADAVDALLRARLVSGGTPGRALAKRWLGESCDGERPLVPFVARVLRHTGEDVLPRRALRWQYVLHVQCVAHGGTVRFFLRLETVAEGSDASVSGTVGVRVAVGVGGRPLADAWADATDAVQPGDVSTLSVADVAAPIPPAKRRGSGRLRLGGPTPQAPTFTDVAVPPRGSGSDALAVGVWVDPTGALVGVRGKVVFHTSPETTEPGALRVLTPQQPAGDDA